MPAMEPLTPAVVGKSTALAFSWENLTYAVGERTILKGLSGKALPARTLAVMGSSGAGKTTFLNALCDRIKVDGECKLTGARKLNEVQYQTSYRKLIGFVTQDDVLSATSTPADALAFSLRIRRGTSAEATQKKVDDLLEELKLTEARNTVVGIPGLVTGLSGGERKRCNIGVELISDPKILLLDEPTSGLDSVTSTKIVSLIRDLSRRGRSVIFSIHQPTAASVSLFDDLLLLCAGKAIYHGEAANAVDYFASCGFVCPDHSTPTDYFMTLMQDAEVSPTLIANWERHLAEKEQTEHVNPAVAVLPENEGKTFEYIQEYCANTGSGPFIQCVELLKRSVVSVSRNKMYILMSIIQAVFFGLVAGIIFVRLTGDVQGIQDRAGVMFMVMANKGFGGAMMMINTFPKEKALFIREQQSGAYSPFFYFISKMFAELPIQFVAVLLESVIIYFMTGLVLDAGRFFHYFAIVFAVFQAAAGLGLLLSTAIDSYVVAAGTAPLAMVPMMMGGGLLASTDRLWPYWVWLEKLSIIRYGFVLAFKNEMSAVDHFSCTPSDFPGSDGVAFCARQPKNGDEVIRQFGFVGKDHEYWVLWMSLAIWIVAMRFFSVVALSYVGKRRT